MPEAGKTGGEPPKRKIGLFVGKLAGGGAERMVSRLSFALSDRFDVTVLILRGERRDYPAAGRVIDLGRGRRTLIGKTVSAVFGINRVIRGEGLEAVISFLKVPNYINGMFNRSCPKAVSLRSWEEKAMMRTPARRIGYALEKRSFSRADAVITLAGRQRQTLIAEMGLAPDRVTVLENLFDAEQITALSRQEPEAAVPEGFLAPHTAVVIGRLAPKKNLRRLLETFAAVKEALADAQLLFLGDGPLREELEAQCEKLGIAASVCFAGRLANPFAVLSRTGLYVSFSENEGFPNACVEAMILGVPVLHTDCPTGPAEILGAGTEGDGACFAPYGVLVPVESKGEGERKRRRAAADAWVRLLTDKALHDKYAAAGRERAKAYSAAEGAARYAALIDRLCGEKS